MRLSHLLSFALTLTLAVLLPMALARVTPVQEVQHHHSTTLAGFNAVGLAGAPSGPPPRGGPPPPRTTTASSSG